MRGILLLALLLAAGCSRSTEPDEEPSGVYATLDSWRVAAAQPALAVTRDGVLTITGTISCSKIEMASLDAQEAEIGVVLSIDALPNPISTRAFELKIHGLDPGLYWLTLEARRPDGPPLTLFFNMVALDDPRPPD